MLLLSCCPAVVEDIIRHIYVLLLSCSPVNLNYVIGTAVVLWWILVLVYYGYVEYGLLNHTGSKLSSREHKCHRDRCLEQCTIAGGVISGGGYEGCGVPDTLLYFREILYSARSSRAVDECRQCTVMRRGSRGVLGQSTMQCSTVRQ